MKPNKHLLGMLRTAAVASALVLTVGLIAACGGGGGSGSGSGSTAPVLSGTITGPSRVVTNQLYQYNATAANGTAANYSWAWGDGSVGTLNASTGTQDKVWRAAGNYTASLTLSASNGTAQASQAVAVVDHPVSTGNEHSCAILTNNTVACWGRNHLGQLGNGTLVNSNAPKVVPGINDVVSLSAYTHGTCVAKTDGTVWCWGDLADIQTLQYSTVPVQKAGLTDVVALSQGNQPLYGPVVHHICALQRAGTVQCWGGNGLGQLGNGTAAVHDVGLLNSFTPVSVTGLTDAVSITAGGQTSCAIKASGAVVCWGYGVVGQVGLGVRDPTATTQMISIPAVVPGVSNAVSVVTSNQLTCAVISDGSVQCWGANNGSQAMGSTTGFVPVTLAGISNVTAMTLGGQHACALKTDATVACWGTYKTSSLTAATAIKDDSGVLLTNVQAVSSGVDHTCASKFDGSVHCWGWNSSGQLGDGANVDHMAARPVLLPSLGATDLQTLGAALTTGLSHACAIKTNGNVACWGGNGFGQLGDGTQTNSNVPVAVSNLVSVTAITGGEQHTCALKASGDVACWGYNGFGQLGNGTNIVSLTPAVPVNIVGGAISVSSGSNHVCALKADGSVVCWGSNSNGELGNGTTINSNIPVVANTSGNVIAISAGKDHTCALKSGGGIICWGSGGYGQYGNGSTNSPFAPVTSSLLGQATSISSGALFRDHVQNPA